MRGNKAYFFNNPTLKPDTHEHDHPCMKGKGSGCQTNKRLNKDKKRVAKRTNHKPN